MLTQTAKLDALSWEHRVGYFSSLFVTAGGVLYFLVLLGAMAAGRFTFPPEEGLQLFGGISSLLYCPAVVLMMVSLHRITPPSKQVLSQAALGFTLLFAAAVSINRFSQLGVVRQAALAGRVDGLSWFLAYGDYSIMLGLEYLGWAWFLGLAMLCAAPLFSGGRLENWIRGLMLLYAALGLISAVGFLLGTWLSLLGFAAWGVVFVIITGLMVGYFRKNSWVVVSRIVE
jgi:hypothetical protein